MEKIFFVFWLMLCTPQQLYATSLSYSFSGKSAVDISQPNTLPEDIPSVVDFSGGFKVDTDIVFDAGVGYAYQAFDFHMLLGNYNIYGCGDSGGGILYWEFDEYGVPGMVGYSYVMDDIPIENSGWNELWMNFNVTPENADDFTIGTFFYVIVDGDAHDVANFSGAITNFSSSVAPVPEPATMLLFGTGLVGLAGARLRKKKK